MHQRLITAHQLCCGKVIFSFISMCLSTREACLVPCPFRGGYAWSYVPLGRGWVYPWGAGRGEYTMGWVHERGVLIQQGAGVPGGRYTKGHPVCQGERVYQGAVIPAVDIQEGAGIPEGGGFYWSAFLLERSFFIFDKSKVIQF